MSNVVLICTKDAKQIPKFQRKLDFINARITPDNISPRPPYVSQQHNTLLLVTNPAKDLTVQDASVCLGKMINPPTNWWEAGETAPDGSYALFRSSEKLTELLTDAAGTRTIWYVHTQELFVAATSQRAIIMILGDFQFNLNAISWMLSAGTLGPGNAWDTRIKPMEGSSRLVFNQDTWTKTIETNDFQYEPQELTYDSHKARLLGALEDTIKGLQLDAETWALPLSGGFDSRAILIFLTREQKRIRCITWGLEASLSDKHNDAYIARIVAEKLNVPHKYIFADLTDEPIDIFLDRFLVAGEGRIDHVGGYLDGFSIWKELYDEGIRGIIRGDESFGWSPVYTPIQVRQSMGLMMLSDYANMRNFHELDLPEQVIPEKWQSKQMESIPTWRDRLYLQFRIPLLMAALTDLKAPYVEVVSPFLSRRVLESITSLPDSLRTNKRLFRELVLEMNPGIAFAKRAAIASTGDFLTSPEAINLIRETLESKHAQSALPGSFLDFLIPRIRVSEETRSYSLGNLKRKVKLLVPRNLRNRLKKSVGYSTALLPYDLLGFRAFLICRIHEILEDDIKQVQSL